MGYSPRQGGSKDRVLKRLHTLPRLDSSLLLKNALWSMESYWLPTTFSFFSQETDKHFLNIPWLSYLTPLLLAFLGKDHACGFQCKDKTLLCSTGRSVGAQILQNAMVMGSRVGETWVLVLSLLYRFGSLLGWLQSLLFVQYRKWYQSDGALGGIAGNHIGKTLS